MRTNTHIFILKLRQLIISILAVIAILAFVFFIFFYRKNDNENISSHPASAYTAGIYTSSITLNDQIVNVQVTVDSDRIKSAEIINLEESVAAMYPLLQTSIDDISAQLAAGTAINNIQYTPTNQYTSQVLINAINHALAKAH